MAIETEFTIKQVNVDDALKEAENKAKETSNKIDKTLNKEKKIKVGVSDNSSKTLDQMKKGIDSVGKMGVSSAGKMKGAFEGLTGLMNPLTAKIAILTAAFAVLWNGIKRMWDRAILSADEYIKKQQILIDEAKQNTNDELSKQNDDNGYLDRLRELNNQEIKTNESKKEAAALISMLTKRYGDLGLSVNAVTGEITGLSEAQKKMLEQQKLNNIKNLKIEQQDTAGLASAKLGKAMQVMNEGAFSGWLESFMFDTFGRAKKGTWDAVNMIESMPLEKQIQVLQKMRDQTNATDEVDALQAVIQLKKQQLKIEQQLSMLNEKGSMSDAEYAKRLKEATTRSEVGRQAGLQKEEEKKQTALKAAGQKMRDDHAFSQMDDTQKIAEYEKQIKARQAEYQKLQGDIDSKKLHRDGYSDQIQIEIDKKEIDRLLSRQLEIMLSEDPADKREYERNEKRLNFLQGKTYTHDADRAKDDTEIDRMQTRQLELQNEQLQRQIEIEKIKKRQADALKKQLQGYDEEIQVQTLILQGRDAEAERLKVINDLKAKGLSTDKATVDAIMQKKQQLKDLSVKSDIKAYGMSLLNQQSSNVNAKQAAYDKKVEEYEKKLGHKLSQSQSALVKNLVDYEYEMQDLKGYKIGAGEIMTNSLTARGGFASGAVVPDKDRINTQIMNYNAKQAQLLQDIKNTLRNAGII